MTARFKQITERLNDDIIGDIIPVRISADMSVATLHALETIFYLRLQLAQAAWEDNEPLYEELCHDRLTQIAAALRKKYKTLSASQPIESGKQPTESGRPDSLTERIEILERLSSIGQLLQTEDYYFAIEEADKLLRHPCRSSESGTNFLPNSIALSSPKASLSYSQKLRLEWIPNIITENESQIAEDLLNSIPNSSFLTPNSSFDMATLAILSDYVTPREREAIFNRFTELVEASVASNDTENLSNLLATAAYWNSSPRFREKIKAFTARLPIPNSSLLIPNLVNPIAAEIYSRIDKITGKYDILSA